MRLEHRHLGVEGGLDLGELDLPLRLDLEMDGVGLRLMEQLLMRGIDLSSRRHGEQLRIGRRL
ncbi:hypothetical protein [Bradyrhizobium amphicarpaeae]|uniref:Uncharacterized protein n=1 Tax=Bradyrhizobium amphicarpaeae TaxID=1404768 RepID=A0A2U8PY08_9BRAD|nr:hypothetical protein [Bradyrhizobium amphicarpaeae]AWM02549.1 hypothetical protein CIT40_22615 [Bradyrhizobium amphicarpaeae]